VFIATISTWASVVFNLKPNQLEEAIKTDLSISMGRTVSGVHYKDDNIQGLKLGQEIVARELPSFLAEKYGANADKVISKIRKMKVDWDAEEKRLLDGYGSKLEKRLLDGYY